MRGRLEAPRDRVRFEPPRDLEAKVPLLQSAALELGAKFQSVGAPLR